MKSILADSYSATPLLYIDVGASGGIKEKWLRYTPNVRFVGFEPAGAAYDQLAGSDSGTFINAALAQESGSSPFYVTEYENCSSLFPPNPSVLRDFSTQAKFRVKAEREVATQRLDDWLAEDGVAHADFLKLDTQGSELAILRGAEDALESGVFGIEVEIEFCQIYQDQPLFGDVDAHLRSKGFVLMDLKRMYWYRQRTLAVDYKGQLVYGDGLYFRRIDRLMEFESKPIVLKAVDICLFYGFVDYALAILEAAGERALLGPSELEPLVNEIRRIHAPSPLSSWPAVRRLRSSLARRLLALARKLAVNQKDLTDVLGGGR